MHIALNHFKVQLSYGAKGNRKLTQYIHLKVASLPEE